MRARSFDAPGRAGTVMYQDRTAASRNGGQACTVEIRRVGKRKGSENQNGGMGLLAVQRRSCGRNVPGRLRQKRGMVVLYPISAPRDGGHASPSYLRFIHSP